jgi:hypothetical protein
MIIKSKITYELRQKLFSQIHWYTTTKTKIMFFGDSSLTHMNQSSKSLITAS